MRNGSTAPAALLAAALVGFATLSLAQAPSPIDTSWSIPEVEDLPNDPQSNLIRRGRDLIVNTYATIGPQAADPAQRYAGNNLNCRTCHLDEGLKKLGNPLWGLTALYPRYDAESGRTITLPERVNGCMERSMNGRPMPLDGPEMEAMMAYLSFISRGLKPGRRLDGYGVGAMAELDRPADPQRGAPVYRQQCAQCHGVNGEGVRKNLTSNDLGYVTPPLWGPDTYNNAAGMNRLITIANFVHDNMPNGTSYEMPRLSVENSWDVAAFVVSQERPRKPDLDKDYPNRLEKPVDTPYGPYADGFSQEQHTYGPFAPIRAAIARLKAAQKP
ncbi:c-type cytochrome [Microvirga flavescens]|uniref:c-type cytochrome n=1 Tax=Microvirga flavescens TaxID=2249811 RepID=UPI000DD79992|nr:c-type cytochrome [Microvirga flavescens]